MIGAIAFVPTPPALVPEVSPGAPEGVVAAREASVRAATALAAVARTWVAVAGAGPTRSGGSTGTFAGYGPDLVVSLGPQPGPVARDLPLPLLVAGWLRGQVGADELRVHPELVDPDAPVAHCRARGQEIATAHDDAALLVLGDGSAKHGTGAPGYADDRAPDLEAEIAKALGNADPAALGRLDPVLCTELSVSGRAAWQVAATVATVATAAGGSWDAEVLYSGAPLGVGYHVVVWNRR